MKVGPEKGALSCVITAGGLTTRSYAARRADTLAHISRCALMGATMVQVREKALGGRLLFDLVSAAVREVGETDTKILVNERFDVAVAAGAHGVHLTSTAIPVDVVRRQTRKDLLIGVSTHSLDELKQAREKGADYAVFGPVFDTPGKSGVSGPKGLEQLRSVCEQSSPFPVLALGGIDGSNFEIALEAGAAGIAAIRLFYDRAEAERVFGMLSRYERQAD